MKLNIGENGKKVLDLKLNQIHSLKTFLLNARIESTQLEDFTLRGGLFGGKAIDSKGPLQAGSYEWTVDRRKFIEGLQEQLSQANIEALDKDFVRQPTSLDAILLELETEALRNDEELANRLLLFTSNQILSSDDSDATLLYKRLMKLISVKLLHL